MVEHQGLHRRAYCAVNINGQDVTSELRPFLISIRVILTSTGEYNRCDIELDDRNAELAIPPPRSTVQVALGWSSTGPSNVTDLGTVPIPPGSDRQLPYSGGSHIVFTGYVLECESGGARSGGGRRLWITAYAPDIMGQGKSPNQQSEGEGDPDDGGGGQQIKLSSFVQKVFKGTGINVQIQDSLASTARDAWQQAGESPFHFLQRVAREIGGRVRSPPGDPNTLLLEREYDGMTVDAFWAWNLIAWRLKPFIPRPQWSQSQSNFFGIAKGTWLDTVSSIGGGTPFGNAGTGGFGMAAAFPNQNVGNQQNQGADYESTDNRGRGWVMLNGEPAAINGGRVNIQGARPGVDGSWGINEVEHTYSRRGYTTRCELNDPQGMSAAYISMGWPVNQRDGGIVTSTPHVGETPPPTPTPTTSPPDASVDIGDLEIKTPQ
jgi:hypothetical protein